jgi:hypothetical protein
VLGAVERKFGQMKRWYRIARAIYWDLNAMKMQVHMTAIVVNLKRALVMQG